MPPAPSGVPWWASADAGGRHGGAARWFLLDTASTFTFVDASMATSLGLPLRGDMMITGGNGSAATITFADDVAFDVGGMAMKSRVAVMALQMKYDRLLAGILGALMEQLDRRLQAARKSATEGRADESARALLSVALAIVTPMPE